MKIINSLKQLVVLQNSQSTKMPVTQSRSNMKMLPLYTYLPSSWITLTNTTRQAGKWSTCDTTLVCSGVSPFVLPIIASGHNRSLTWLGNNRLPYANPLVPRKTSCQLCCERFSTISYLVFTSKNIPKMQSFLVSFFIRARTHDLNEKLGRHSGREGRSQCNDECENIAHVLWDCPAYRISI